jgi:pimeloyl-ACP methyl ester carboxylesterase
LPCADDIAAVTAHLDLKNAIHVGHSTGGGEVVHYIARRGEERVSKAAIISAMPPLMVQTPTNPGCRRRCSTISRWRSRPTARNSIATSPLTERLAGVLKKLNPKLTVIWHYVTFTPANATDQERAVSFDIVAHQRVLPAYCALPTL